MEILDIKSFQETLNSGMCGPASLKMILEYWGINKSEQELAQLCETDYDLGTTIHSLKRAAESLGLKTEIKFSANFSDIESWLHKKIPLIVDWFSRGRSDYDNSAVADGHYSVIVGLDENFIYLQDPEIGGLRKIEKNDFLKVWFDFTGSYIKSLDEIMIRPLIAIHPDKINK